MRNSNTTAHTNNLIQRASNANSIMAQLLIKNTVTQISISDNEVLVIDIHLSNNQNLILATTYCPNRN